MLSMKDEKIPVSVRLPDSLHNHIKELAIRSGVSVHKYILRVLENGAEHNTIVSEQVRIIRENRPKYIDKKPDKKD